MSQDVGAIGDMTEGMTGRTTGVGVNYWGLDFRTKMIWLNSPLTSSAPDG
jgi:hypothetical protein